MCDDAVEHETEIKIFLEEQGMLWHLHTNPDRISI
jgi:hypothetical protein